jgi:hypothetical protein
VWVLWNPNAPEPGWLIDGFENLPHHVTLAIEASEQSPKARTLDYTLWRRRVEAAGGLVLGARQIADRRSPAGMYGIVVTGPDRSMESHVEKSEAQRSK